MVASTAPFRRWLLFLILVMDINCKHALPAPHLLWSVPWTDATTASHQLRGALVDDDRIVLVEGTEDSQIAIARARRTGAELWRSQTMVAVLLPARSAEPIYAVTRRSADRIELLHLDAATGAVVRTLPIAASLVPDWASWYRVGGDVVAVAESTIVRIDAMRGVAAWRTSPDGVVLAAPLGFVATATRAYVVCHTGPGGEYRYGLCRFALADGHLEEHSEQDVAQIAAAGSGHVAVLDDRTVAVLADDGAVRWRQPLPDGFHGHRLVAGEHWVALVALGAKDRAHAPGDRGGSPVWAAYDASNGTPSWRAESASVEALVSTALALADGWLVYGRTEDGRPALWLRWLPDRGEHRLVELTATILDPLAGAASAESLRGAPIVAPPLVLIPRQAKLEAYEAP